MDLLRDINYEIVALQETLVAAELLLSHRREQVTEAEVAARDVRVEIAHLEGARRRLLVASGAAHEDTLRDRVRRVARMVGDDVQADLRRAQALVARAYPPDVAADVAPEDVRAHSCVCHGAAPMGAPPDAIHGPEDGNVDDHRIYTCLPVMENFGHEYAVMRDLDGSEDRKCFCDCADPASHEHPSAPPAVDAPVNAPVDSNGEDCETMVTGQVVGVRAKMYIEGEGVI